MSTPGSQAKRKRPYGVSCMACREKKIPCDGNRPRCGACKDTKEECKVPESVRPLRRLRVTPVQEDPTDVARLAERMQRMEHRVRQLEEILDLPPTRMPSPTSEHPIHTNGDSAKYQLSLDDSGNVVFHGLTSWSSGPDMVSENPRPPAPGMTDPALAPFFQALASAKHISVSPELGDALLNAYFSSQVFNIIQRSTFLRDMALGGPLFSEFLLMAMYATATRRIDGIDVEERKAQCELFDRLAKEYLAKELQGPTKIPTIQGLLLLSGRECAMGDISQGWNHAGLAFRMILDLGIHLPPESVAGAALSQEEQATRARLFWSAFIWDKSISLALGREPTFPARQGRDPSAMPDFDDDEEPWTPYFINPNNCPWSLVGYVYQPQRRVAAFRFLARLCLILHDVIVQMYTDARLSSRQRMGFVTRTRQRLDEFWEIVPATMKFNPSQPSPPPWIFVFQLLYHATCILLHRPTLDPADIPKAQGNVATCLQHSITAHQMAVSYTNTFGERMTYVAMYSSFVAASFDILLLDADRVDIQLEALSRLKAWLSLMDKSAVQVQSIRRSVQHISASTSNAISKHPALAMSDVGRSMITQQPDLEPITGPMEMFDGTGVFDFFELLRPV